VLRSRTGASMAGDLPTLLTAFAAKARAQTDDVLARCWDGTRFVDRPGLDRAPEIRPWCDAVEIADLLVRRTPAGHTTDDLVRFLRSSASEAEITVLEGPANYHILCVGYALRLLGSDFGHP